MRNRSSVLIVDDDEDIRDALRILLRVEGFNVVGEAASGYEAIGPALKQQPNFIILDYLMPKMNGEMAAEVFRRVTPDSKIVAFSAVLTSRPDWADAFLNKDRIGRIAQMLKSLARSKGPREALVQ